MNIIKLQPDQISLFWDLIKHAVINSYKIPRDFQQDFTNKYLENLLLGLYQCWVGYTLNDEGEKKIHAILCTKITDEKDYGIRTLSLIGTYSFRLIPQEMVETVIGMVERFAKANNCDVIATEYRLKRIGDMLKKVGFEKHITIARKILSKEVSDG